MWTGLFGFGFVFCLGFVAGWVGLVVVLLVDFGFGLLFVIDCLLGVFGLVVFCIECFVGWDLMVGVFG